MASILSAIASFFRSSNDSPSDKKILLNILNLTKEKARHTELHPDGQAAILISPNDHDFFKDLNASMNERLNDLDLSHSTVKVIEEDKHGTAWTLVNNDSFENLVADVDQISESIFMAGLGPRMIAAVFKGQFRETTVYWVCNYRTAKFYPFIPIGNQTRDNELEIDMGDILIGMGIPVEPHSNWYALWDIPI